MRIIIIGAGAVGSAVAEQLINMNHNIVVIDKDPDRVQYCVSNFDVSGVVGSGTDFRVLREAGVTKAHLLLAVTGSDEVNLISCLFARKAGAAETIARITNPEYFEQIEVMKNDLGLAMTVNPDSIAADEIARQLRLPSAGQVDFCAGGRIEIVSVAVASDGPLVGLNMIEFRKRYGSILVCAIENKDGEIVIPSGHTAINDGDKLYITARPSGIINFFKKIKMYTSKAKRVMLIGGGKISYYLA